MDAHALIRLLEEQDIKAVGNLNYRIDSHEELTLTLKGNDIFRVTTLLAAGVKAETQERRIIELERTLESLMSSLSKRQHAWLQEIEPNAAR